MVIKPDGTIDQLTSGSKPEHGTGGFETYGNVPGTYKIQFMGQNFEIPLGGQQFTKITFNQMADPDSAANRSQDALRVCTRVPSRSKRIARSAMAISAPKRCGLPRRR